VILKAAFQIEQFIFLYVVIASPSHFKKDKRIDSCVEWIASLVTELKRTGNILVTENNPRSLRWKRFAPLPVQTFVTTLVFMIAKVVAGLLSFLCSSI